MSHHKKEKRKENPFKMQNIFIVAAKRTPFGSFGGSLKSLTATDLATVATKAALESGNVDPSVVDSVFVGNVIQSSADAAYLARHVGLVSLLDVQVNVLLKSENYSPMKLSHFFSFQRFIL